MKRNDFYLKIKLPSFSDFKEKSFAALTVGPIFKRAKFLRLNVRRRLLDNLKNLIALILAKTQDNMTILNCAFVLYCEGITSLYCPKTVMILLSNSN